MFGQICIKYSPALLTLTILSFISGVQSNGIIYRYGDFWSAYYACVEVISAQATFCEAYGFGCYCFNDAAMSTFAECLAITKQNTTSNIDKVIENCAELNVTLTREKYDLLYENATQNAVNVSSVANFNYSIPIDYPILLDSGTADFYVSSYIKYLGNIDDSIFYGAGMIGYWAMVFLFASVYNWTIFLFPAIPKYFTGRYSNLYRRYISLTSTGSRKRMQEKSLLIQFFSGLVPSRTESLILSGFFFVLIAMCTRNVSANAYNPVLGDRLTQVSRYAGDRTGITVCYLIPLLILFAGRNNFLMWVTRWNFATFITYHRWVSRISVLLVFIHAVGLSIAYARENYYHEVMVEDFVIRGVLALVAGSIMMFQGLLFFRRRWYEIFLFIHIALAAIFVAGAWNHCDIMTYGAFYYASVAVWVFDRFVRIVRLVFFGFPMATIQLFGDDTVRVSIKRPSYWKPSPGGHAFVHFLGPTYFWQSHPFTYVDGMDGENTIVLYCKIKGGVTHSLCRYLSNQPNKTGKIRVGVEGPYGDRTASDKYDTAVFIAGGNGIPGLYSEITDLARRNVERQHLKLYWIVRESKAFSWFKKEISALKDSKIEAIFYVTKPEALDYSSNPSTNESSDEEKKSDTIEVNEKTGKIGLENLKEEYSFVEFRSGRPDINDIVHEEITTANGSVSFVTCGHPIMVDDIRYSVVNNLDKSNGKRVDFFEQLQVWA